MDCHGFAKERCVGICHLLANRPVKVAYLAAGSLVYLAEIASFQNWSHSKFKTKVYMAARADQSPSLCAEKRSFDHFLFQDFEVKFSWS